MQRKIFRKKKFMLCLVECRFYFFCLAYFLISNIFPLQAEEWSQPTTLSLTGQNAASPQIAVDSHGNAIAVWYRFDGKHLVIQASTKSVNGNWQSVPDNLSSSDQDASNPQIAIDCFGNATVIWEQFNGNHWAIYASSKPVNSHWQSTPSLLSLIGQNASAPQVAYDSFGNATAVWQSSDGYHSIIQASTKALDGNWQALPEKISSQGWNAKNPQILIDSFKTATVVWQASDGEHETIQAASRLFPDKWQLPETLCSPAISNSSPKMGVDSFGNLTVVWNQYNGNFGTIQASTKMCGRNWQQIPDTLSLPEQNTFSPDIVVDPMGNATAVWESFDAKKIKVIQASTKPFGESWNRNLDKLSSSEDHNVCPRLAVDLSGNVKAVWNNYKGFTRIYVASKPSGECWQSNLEEISSPGRSVFSPQITIDSFGRALVVWVTQDSLSFIQASSR